MAFKWQIQHVVSAGGVVYRWTGETIEVVLCGRRDPVTWRLPKGTPDQGESLEETAVREAHEETGLDVAVEEPLGTTSYWFVANGTRYHKTVHFYLMAACGGSVALHDPEFDEARWFPVDEGAKTLTYANEAGMVRKALRVLTWRGGARE